MEMDGKEGGRRRKTSLFHGLFFKKAFRNSSPIPILRFT